MIVASISINTQMRTAARRQTVDVDTGDVDGGDEDADAK